MDGRCRYRSPLRRIIAAALPCVLIAAVLAATGCLVEQPMGMNKPHVVGPNNDVDAPFFIYEPAGFDKAMQYPVVMVMHGLNPFDTWDKQINAWQKAADEYQFIVVVPKLETTQPHCPIPPSPNYGPLDRDRRNVIAILDYVIARWNADPNQVLLTSWSAGGYVANYIMSRHPDRFSALALWGSNWSPDLVDLQTFAAYTDRPIYVGYGENDFEIGAKVRTGSRVAANFYRNAGFRVIEWEEPQLGHQRRPARVASFFSNIGRRQKFERRQRQREVQLDILASSRRGVAPLTVSFAVRDHPAIAEGAAYQWLFDSPPRPISTDAKLVKVIDRPGYYPIEVIVTNPDGTRFRAKSAVHVLDPALRYDDVPRPYAESRR